MVQTETALRYIDSDGHILEPPTGMLEFAPAAYRDRIWHVETDADGREWVVYDGGRTPAGGLAGTAGFSDEKVDRVRAGEISYTADPPVRWTAVLRLADLDTDGIELSVLYPTFMLGLAEPERRRVRRVQARAYNDWCSAHLHEGQGRLFGAGALPPMHEPSDVQAWPTRSATWPTLPGMVSVFMRPNPAVDWRQFNDPVYDPIWAAAAGHRPADRLPSVPGPGSARRVPRPEAGPQRETPTAATCRWRRWTRQRADGGDGASQTSTSPRRSPIPSTS